MTIDTAQQNYWQDAGVHHLSTVRRSSVKPVFLEPVKWINAFLRGKCWEDAVFTKLFFRTLEARSC